MNSLAVSVSGKKRVYYLDLLRAIACLCIIIIHSSGFFVVEGFSGTDFWIGNTLDSAARMGVPLFVMISGALMLDEDRAINFKETFSRIKRMLIFLFFWSAVYAAVFGVLSPILMHEKIVVKDVVFSFLTAGNHLWFMYMIIGLYIVIPLLRLWISKKNVIYVKYFLILWLVFASILPQIAETLGLLGSSFDYLKDIIMGILNNVYFRYATGYVGCFVLGWYLRSFDINHKAAVYLMGIVGVVTAAIATWAFSVRANESVTYYNYLYVGVIAEAAAVFVLVKAIFSKSDAPTRFMGRALCTISKYSLGIYAVHAGIITCMHKVLSTIGFKYAAVEIPVVSAIALGSALLISFVLSKIPGLKKLV